MSLYFSARVWPIPLIFINWKTLEVLTFIFELPFFFFTGSFINTSRSLLLPLNELLPEFSSPLLISLLTVTHTSFLIVFNFAAPTPDTRAKSSTFLNPPICFRYSIYILCSYPINPRQGHKLLLRSVIYIDIILRRVVHHGHIECSTQVSPMTLNFLATPIVLIAVIWNTAAIYSSHFWKN